MVKKNKRKDYAVAAVLFLLLIGVIALLSNFSLVGGDAPDCVIPYGGGSCSVNVSLAANEQASQYVLDIRSGAVSADNFTEPVSFTHIDSYSGIEEDDRDDGEELSNVHLYKLPSSWEGTTEILVDARANGEATASRDYDRTDVEVEVRYLNVNYPYDYIRVCHQDRVGDCTNDPILIHDYRNNDGEDQLNIRLERPGNILDSFDLTPRNTDGTRTGEVYEVAVLPVERPISQYRFIVTTTAAKEEGGRVSIEKVPRVMASYRPGESFRSGEVHIGGRLADSFALNETFQGRTGDMSSYVNAACDRPSSVQECSFTLTVTSSEGGEVYLSENSLTLYSDVELAPVEDPEPEEEDDPLVDEENDTADPVNDTEEPVQEGDQPTNGEEENNPEPEAAPETGNSGLPVMAYLIILISIIAVVIVMARRSKKG